MSSQKFTGVCVCVYVCHNFGSNARYSGFNFTGYVKFYLFFKGSGVVLHPLIQRS